MWPFKRNFHKQAASVIEGLRYLGELGIRVRPGISYDDLLYSLGGTMDSPVEWLDLLSLLGGEVQRGEFSVISDDIWDFDTECIEDQGDYVQTLKRFVALTGGALPLTNLRDYVDVEEGVAWVEFELEGKSYHWDLVVYDDWFDPGLLERLGELVRSRDAGKQFGLAVLGQNSLVVFCDKARRKALSKLTGIDFS